MKQNTIFSLVFLFSFISAIAQNQPAQNEIDAAILQAQTQGRVFAIKSNQIDVSTILAQTSDLPVVFRSIINDWQYDIAVLDMKLESNTSFLKVACKFSIPDADNSKAIYFANSSIVVSAKSGFVGDLPILKSLLNNTSNSEIEDPDGNLQGETFFFEFPLPNLKNQVSMGLNQHSKISFNCGAFNQFHLSGFLKAYQVDVETSNGQLVAQKPFMVFFNNQTASDWQDMYLTGKVAQGIRAKKYADMGIHFSAASAVLIDLSKQKSPSNLPTCVRNKEAWQGIYIDSFSLRLPTFFHLRSNGQIPNIPSKTIFIDDSGLLGTVSAQKVFTLSEGYTDEDNRYNMSLNNISANYLCAGQVNVSMQGDIQLPFCSTTTKGKAVTDLAYSMGFLSNQGGQYETLIKGVNDNTFQTNYTLPSGSKLAINVNGGNLNIHSDLVDKPKISTTAYHQTICKGFSASLLAQNCGTNDVRWSDNKQGNSINVSPEQTTTYTALCYQGDCPSPVSNSITIRVVEQLPKLNIRASKTTFCANESIGLDVDGCVGVVEWKTPNNTNWGSIEDTHFKVSGDYYARCKLNDCYGDVSEPFTINVLTVPNTPSIRSNAEDGKICSDKTLSLIADGCGDVIKWLSFGNSSLNPFDLTPEVGNRTYSAICVSSSGCSSNQANIAITGIKKPMQPNLYFQGQNTPSLIEKCEGTDVVLTTGCMGVGSPVWEKNGQWLFESQINAKELGTNSYRVNCKNDICMGEWSGKTTVKINPYPSIPIIQSTVANNTAQVGQTVTLSVNNCNGTVGWPSLNWETGSNKTLTLSNQGTFTYEANCASSDGCFGPRGAITLVVVGPCNIPSKPSISPNTGSICAGSRTVLTTNCSGSVLWNTGQTSNTLEITQAGTYSVKCSNGCGTVDSDAITISSGQAPNKPTITATATSICPNENVTLTASNCLGSIAWDNNSNSTTRTVSNGGTYSVQCSNACGTSQSATIVITTKSAQECVGNPPCTPITNISITANPASISTGGNTTLSLSGNGLIGNTAYTWTGTGLNNANTQSTSVSSLTVGTHNYTVTATNANGTGTCTATATVSVKVVDNPPPPPPCNINAPTSSGDKYFTQGQPIPTLSVTVGSSEEAFWYKDGEENKVPLHTGITYQPFGEGIYLVYARKGACRSSATSIKLEKKVAPCKPPLPVISCQNPNLCRGENTVIIAVNCANGTIQWYKLDETLIGTGSSISVSPDVTTYYVARCKIGECLSEKSNELRVGVGLPSSPIVYVNGQQVSYRDLYFYLKPSETANFTAGSCSRGTVQWYRNGGVIDDVSHAIEGEYYALCISDFCQSSRSQSVKIHQWKPKKMINVRYKECNSNLGCLFGNWSNYKEESYAYTTIDEDIKVGIVLYYDFNITANLWNTIENNCDCNAIKDVQVFFNGKWHDYDGNTH